MTNEEFSTQFDALLNSYRHISSFGTPDSLLDINLDEYEKSLLLTKAQENIILGYIATELIDNTSKILLDLSSLILIYSTDEFINGSTISDSGIVIDLTDLGTTTINDIEYNNIPLTILNERVKTLTIDNRQNTYVVVPIHYKEYDRILSKAYAEPLKRLAWRLFLNQENSIDKESEIILRSDAGTFVEYKLRYIRKPIPIILTDLDTKYNALSIEGISKETSCELSSTIHSAILLEAVRLALTKGQAPVQLQQQLQ